MKIYLYPNYVNLESAAGLAPKLFQFFRDRGVKLEEAHWNGTIGSLPIAPSIIRASSMQRCSDDELAEKCKKLGHIVFYNDNLLLPDGTYDDNTLIDAMTQFLDQNPD